MGEIWLESESSLDGPDVFLEVNGSFGDEMLNWRWQKKKQVCARQYKYRKVCRLPGMRWHCIIEKKDKTQSIGRPFKHM